MEEIRFDDIDALKAQITEEPGEFGPAIDVTQDMINQFADTTGDHQWIHIDVERCKKESPFGGPIAHGFLTLSLVASLNTNLPFKVTGFGNATNYGSDGFRFLAPVPAGAKVHARARLIDAKAKPKGTVLTVETSIHEVGNDVPALVYKGLVMYNPPIG